MNADIQPKHWRDPESFFSARSSYSANSHKSSLKITSIKLSDSGRYKCRVDYHLEQTSFQLIDLIVIVPPEKPRIFYETEQVQSNRLHVTENQSVTLVCESKGNCQCFWYSPIKLILLFPGGVPLPALTWWQDYNLIDKSFQRWAEQRNFFKIIYYFFRFNNKVVNKLELVELGRENLNSLFICQASNNNLSMPVSTSVKLDLSCKKRIYQISLLHFFISVPPLSVKILRTDHTLIVGQSRTLECEVTGARPKPKITWWKGGTQLRESQSRVIMILSMEKLLTLKTMLSNENYFPWYLQECMKEKAFHLHINCVSKCTLHFIFLCW